MSRFLAILVVLVFVAPAGAAEPAAPGAAKDLYYSESLFYAYQGEWFEAIARLDSELGQFHGLDEPERDSLFTHIGQAEFNVGDFELFYRMHRRAGRAIKAVIEGNVAEPVRNEAIFRLARIFFQKDMPESALQSVERIQGAVPAGIRSDLAFLRANIDMANDRNAEAARILEDHLGEQRLAGFSSYNLAIALLRDGNEQAGREYLDRTGRIESSTPAVMAIKDKSNLILGDKLLREKEYAGAKAVLDRVSLNGPFSNRALLGSGWADAFQGRFDRALVPWTVLAGREVTDLAVQEALLAVPYAYGRLGIYSKAALEYGRALEAFDTEIEKLDASIASISAGKFLQALVREELKQDADWVVKLRELPETPETFYLLGLMASHDFQESLKNYLDLEDLRRRLEGWERDLDAFEDIIAARRAYYEPLLPAIDREFRLLDSQMRLRLEQRDRIEQRLQNMLVVPRPDYLATAEERVIREQLAHLERALTAGGADIGPEIAHRIRRARGVLIWNILTQYDQRFTDAHKHLRDLNGEIDALKRHYSSFVRTRQAATQSYAGYNEVIRSQRLRIQAARVKVAGLMARQGEMLENMALNELGRRRDRLEEFQVKASFAMAASYDRAGKNQQKKDGQ